MIQNHYVSKQELPYGNAPNYTSESTGAALLPGGLITLGGYHVSGSIGNVGYFWSSSASGTDKSYAYVVGSTHTNLGKVSYDNNTGFSIRFVKD